MDEAQQVLDRLRRIELLEQEGAPAAAILAEVRELLAKAEAWVWAERPPGARAEAAVEALRGALKRAEERSREAERTLVA